MEMIKKCGLLQIVVIFLLASCGSSNNENDVPSAPLLTLSELTVDSVGNIFYPQFSPDTRHYAASCGDGELFSMELTNINQEAQIYINNVMS